MTRLPVLPVASHALAVAADTTMPKPTTSTVPALQPLSQRYSHSHSHDNSVTAQPGSCLAPAPRLLPHPLGSLNPVTLQLPQYSFYDTPTPTSGISTTHTHADLWHQHHAHPLPPLHVVLLWLWHSPPATLH